MKKSKIFLYLTIFLFLLSLDILLKAYTFNFIPKMSWVHPAYPFGGIGVFKGLGMSFSINHVENLGAAWGIFAKYSNYLLYLRIFVFLGLIAYLIFNKKEKCKFFILLITIGALGNILDFLWYGTVIDMFYFKFGPYSYPVFNLADSYITIGIIGLILFQMFKKRKIDESCDSCDRK
ncbi:MAG: signal peptidase II [Chlamydiae bacterium]|nr:signal peptidase II [Chlamydiota bacterium]